MVSTIVLVTGANSGVGYATAKALVQHSEQYHVILACRSSSKAETAKSQLEASSIRGTLSVLELDVTQEASVIAAAEHVLKSFGKLDALINNAAIGSQSDDTFTRFRDTLETNVVGPAIMTAAFRPLLLKSNDPYSIFVSSGAGSMTRSARKHPSAHNMRNEDAYHVSKAGLNMLAVLEHRDHGQKIKVFAASPGFVISNLRGPSEEQRTGWGMAAEGDVAGQFMLDILLGSRDEDVGKLIYKDGVYEW